MSRGESGRVVVELDPELKRQLYSRLALSGLTLKDWFIQNATQYCEHATQGDLFVAGKAKSEEQRQPIKGQDQPPAMTPR